MSEVSQWLSQFRKENVKGALTLQINWSCAKTLKPVSDFALLKQN